MYVLDDGAALGRGELDVREVPDGIHTVRGQKLGRCDRVSLGDTQNGGVNLVLGKVIGKGGHIVDLDTRIIGADKLRLDVEGGFQIKAPGLERKVAQKCLTEVADADEDGAVAPVHAEDGCDLRAQCGDLVAVALLAEFAEAAEVLTDLRGGEAELAAQLAGGYAAYARFRELIELSEIARKTADNVI